MLDIIRESTIGGLLNTLTDGRILPYPDQRPGFVLPKRCLSHYTPPPPASSASSSSSSSASSPLSPSPTLHVPTAEDDLATASPEDFDEKESKQLQPDVALEAGSGTVVYEKALPDTKGYTLVDWYGPDDPENPHNWSFAKRSLVMFEIMLLTYVCHLSILATDYHILTNPRYDRFSVYIGSAIYTASIPLINVEFGVSNVVSTLGLSLFVFGYGLGPLVCPSSYVLFGE